MMVRNVSLSYSSRTQSVPVLVIRSSVRRKIIFRLVALAHQVRCATTGKRALSHCQKRKQYIARVSSIVDSLYTHPMEPPFSHLFTSYLFASNKVNRY